MSKEFEKMI